MALLGKILRVRGLSMRAVEQTAGMGPNSLSRLLQGKKNAYLSHVFRVLATLGITPGQFFRLAYPDEPHVSPTSLLDPKLEKLATGKTAAEDEEEFKNRVESAVRRVLDGKLGAEAERGAKKRSSANS
jgi:transcriptional regulator with XRE-family HTH domain